MIQYPFHTKTDIRSLLDLESSDRESLEEASQDYLRLPEL
jgi:hypothetical protein